MAALGMELVADVSDSIHSPAWYRVAQLRPSLRAQAEVHRHDYRGETWYVLEDRAAGRVHRFTPAANHVIGLMDGDRDVDAIWRATCEQLGDDAPTQGETIVFLGQLHAANVLRCDVPPDAVELFRRHEKQRGAQLRQRFAHPLAVRIPLLDPDRFLDRWLPPLRPLFGVLGLLLWLSVTLTGLALAVSHWAELSANVADRLLTPHNLLLLWLVYPCVKALHELGHAFAAKRWGGEVHEIGLMLLVLVPVPYVEASSASAFRSKYQRMVVSGAGILVELFLAALAAIVWTNVEPGTVRTVAWNVMLIGGVSTLLFNGNPLLRFDGYYVLADAVEMPNLATRSRRYLAYLAQRYLLGIDRARSPVTGRGERAWLLGYGLASFAYRMFIMTVIVLFIVGKFFFVGVLLGAWAVTTQLLVPLLKNISFLFRSPQLQRRRLRTASTVASVVTVAGVALALPAPSWTRAEGVVWLPESAQVRSDVDGFVVRTLVEDGSRVAVGDALVRSEDPLLDARVALLEARVREFDARLVAVGFRDRSALDLLRQQRESVTAELDRAREQRAALTVRSAANGRFVSLAGADLAGRFVRRGELLGHVAIDDGMTVRVVVPQARAALVRGRTERVEAWPVTRDARPIVARVVRTVPAAAFEIPSAVLAVEGGGELALDPRTVDTLRTLERVFQLELALPDGALPDHAGTRVHVRFDHGHEAVAAQAYRAIEQLLLRHFAT